MTTARADVTDALASDRDDDRCPDCGAEISRHFDADGGFVGCVQDPSTQPQRPSLPARRARTGRGRFVSIHADSHAARARKRAAGAAKVGRPTKKMNALTLQLATQAAISDPAAVDLEKLAHVTHRSPEVIKQKIREARQKLQQAAPQLVDDALAAATVAASKGRVAGVVALLEKIPAEGDARVMDPPLDARQAGGVQVQIGFQLGGVGPGEPR